MDIGEGFAHDEDLLEFATSANICCGAHAGSHELTGQTVELCRRKGVRIGAHPGYPDRPHMGRRSMQVEEHRAYLDSIFRQMRDFVSLARPAYIKPHGAFYNDTAVLLPEGWDSYDELLEPGNAFDPGGIFLSKIPGAGSLGMLLRVYRLPLMGLSGTSHEAIAGRANQPLIREGFADRTYEPDGTLMPRDRPGAVLKDPALVRKQVLELAERVDSICLHGDTPGCLEYAETVVRALRDGGFEVRAA
ncbi:MAG TPA: 5-oxoprolinase subunit PxpA [Fimbriimonadaceae bacterium]|nr:5-oxoprolinase subunit PxpA [Fimbriimonadaceae bacterium]